VLVDFDDYCEDQNRLDLLGQLREINPAFRCTVFAIPARGSEEFWRSTPDWIELAVHGWEHPHPREAEAWTYEQASFVMAYCNELFAHGFKAPGWQISDDTYSALQARGWWVADHWENNQRRPIGQLSHVIAPDYATVGDHWHGHIQNVCGNGLEETFHILSERVATSETFDLISERVSPWASLPR
jgi:hypothetical protein